MTRLGSWGGKIALLVVSAVGSVLLAELVLRAVGFEWKVLQIDIGTEHDHRGYHIFDDQYFVYDPELLWRPRPGFEVFNEQGFRGPVLASTKPGGEFRIFAVGDSNTLGWGGDGGYNWPGELAALLDRIHDRYRVVNAGVYGFTSHQGLIRLREVLRYEPDLILISFGANDAHPVWVADREYGQAAELRERRRRPGADWRLAQLLSAGRRALQPRRRDQLTRRVPLEQYRQNLERMLEETAEIGARPVLLTRPYTGEIRDELYWKNFGSTYNLATVEVAEADRVPVVDLYSHFRGRHEEFTDDSHFTQAGHQRAASILLTELRPWLAPESQEEQPAAERAGGSAL